MKSVSPELTGLLGTHCNTSFGSVLKADLKGGMSDNVFGYSSRLL